MLARVDGEPVGETRMWSVRADVCAALRLPEGTATAFRLLGRLPGAETAPRQAVVTLHASWPGEKDEWEVAKFAVRLVPALLSQRPYGDVVHPEQRKVLHRENIYGSGPPVDEVSGEALELIRGYLPRGSSVLDVGCGIGPYGRELRADGHPWLGLEVNPLCCELLLKRGLPVRQVTAATGRLPCADGEFDGAICIEVLEHIADVDAFLGEIVRTIRGRALFSVPNLEVIPYFSQWQVVPWHLLEADHKNFFTRASLRELLLRHFARVEVFSYSEHPLRTADGIPLHVHLFAIAEK
jgi:SAM-dependent methyltransferase